MREEEIEGVGPISVDTPGQFIYFLARKKKILITLAIY
jgi:hypothetical protein